MKILKIYHEEQLLIKFSEIFQRFQRFSFNIAKNSKYDGCQKGLASMVYNFFFFFLIKSLLKVVALIMKLNKMRN